MQEKYIALAKKLNELAKRGVGGEKLNAQHMLEQILKKHNLTMDDIEVSELNEYMFTIQDNHHRLFPQIVGVVNPELKIYGCFPDEIIKMHKLKGNFMVPCCNADFIHIQAMHEFYARLFDEELKLFVGAFIAANDLYANAANPKDITTATREQMNEWRREQMMAANIKSMKFHKQLNNS